MTSLPMIQVALFAQVGFGEPTMAIALISDRDLAKTHNPRPAWEKSKWNPFIMAIPKKKRRSRQTRLLCVGKIVLEPG